MSNPESFEDLRGAWAAKEVLVATVRVDERTVESPVIVNNSRQRIQWRADDPHARVVVLFNKETQIEGAHYDFLPDGSCELSGIPTGNRGTHRYTVVVFKEGSEPIVIDPEIIVKY